MTKSIRVHLLALLGATACAEDDDAGTAPEITSLAVMPEQIAAGGQSMVDGQVGFTDPDGDVETIELELTDLAGTPMAMEVAVTGAEGLEQGTVAFVLVLAPPSAGTYPLAVRLVDAEGNASAPAQTELVAQ